MTERLLIGLALIVGPLLVLRRAIHRILTAERARSKTPFTEKLLRPAGESLRVKIDEIRDQMDDKMTVFALLIVLPAFLAMLTPLKTTSVKIFAYLSLPAICWAFAALQWRKIQALRKELRNHNLGFDGERYIASELDLLRSDGFRIYHDFVFDMKPGGDATTFNIDHIAVGPFGIFAIETKTRRKPKEEPDGKQRNHEVVFDGKALIFPAGFRDTSAIEQATRTANDLREWLTGNSGETIPVLAVVAIPGWFVDRRGNSDVRVLSGKELAKTLRALKGRFPSPERLPAIADRIEAHCRDVDVL